MKLDSRLVAPRFEAADAERANEEWGFNCGPAALALVAGLTPEELRPHMGDFEQKRYTNPTLMFECLNRLGLLWHPHKASRSRLWMADGYDAWPKSFGLVRVQWEGSWTAPDVPVRVRYRHTHWIACLRIDSEEPNIFDINCLHFGGWAPLSQWAAHVVPWILKNCEPKADGKWHLTHVLEVKRPACNSIADADLI